MSSAILYVAIVAIWIGVLVPRWLRHDSPQSRPAGLRRFSLRLGGSGHTDDRERAGFDPAGPTNAAAASVLVYEARRESEDRASVPRGEVTDVFNRERSFKAVSDAIARDSGGWWLCGSIDA